MSSPRIRVPAQAACILLASAAAATAGPAIPPTPLPLTGTAVRVSTVQQLQNAVAAIASNTTILIAPGTIS